MIKVDHKSIVVQLWIIFHFISWTWAWIIYFEGFCASFVGNLIDLADDCFHVLCSQPGCTWPVGSVLVARDSVLLRLEAAASARMAIPWWTGPRGPASAPSSWPSWRRSSTSTSTWRGPGGWRSPAPCSSARRRWKFGFRTDAWSRRNYRETGCSLTQGPRLRTHTLTLWTPAPLLDRPHHNTCNWTPEPQELHHAFHSEGTSLQMFWFAFASVSIRLHLYLLTTMDVYRKERNGKFLHARTGQINLSFCPASDWRSDLNIKIQVISLRSYLHNVNGDTKLY